MRKNIFAFTPNSATSPPPYISINEDEDGVIRLTVRGLQFSEKPAAHAVMDVPVEELLKMAAAVNTHCFTLQKRGHA